jgi:hypothetical protein
MKFKILILLLFISLQGLTQPAAISCKTMHKIPEGKFSSAVSPAGYTVSHYDIHIDTINFSMQEIKGMTAAKIKALQPGINSIQLALQGFNIDSIVSGGNPLTYSYNDTIIDIQLINPLSTNDSVITKIYYHGTPAQDASGWGGFYFNSNFAFNLGVGFQAEPHNFGRAWFACIDDFTTKSSYNFYITTDAASKAFCNGSLQQSIVNPNSSVTWIWSQSQPIPSYLASMAVAPYYTLEKISNGIPVQWACLPIDTNNVLATFSNLDTILAAYINSYGSYPFDKVGYCLIPFNSGAMEHAASIHIGRAFVNGSQSYSTLWAHELSHMWWGDKVTCETAEDMWLNEGFATYNEAFYNQVVNGETAYRDWIRSNHRKVLQFAHTPTQDGAYFTMNNIPHSHTYGFHVYQKGADIVHTLRNYMGDNAFYSGCQAYMNNRAYSNASSAGLRDELTAGSGINMNRFFDDWIFTAGFPHVSIDSVIHIPGGLDHMYVYTRQRSKANNHLYELPVEINFSNGITDTTVRVIIDSVTNMFHIPLYFMPTWTSLDRFEKVSDAISSNEKLITSIGSQIIQETNVTLNVLTVSTPSSIVRIEHNFVPPDPFVNANPGIRLSDYHYWKADGIFYPGFLSKAIFVYDGSTSGTTGYLDNTLITGTEDSLVILYRQKAGMNWEIVNSYTLNSGANLVDKKGSFTVDTLLQGEYTIGMYDYTVGTEENTVSDNSIFTASPNPSDNELNFQVNVSGNEDILFNIYDIGGRKIYERVISNRENFRWDCSKISNGIYNAVLIRNGRKLKNLKIVVSR